VLTSSNIHLEVLSGRDETIDFDDYLNGLPFFFACYFLFFIYF